MSILPALSSNYLVSLWCLCQTNIIPLNLIYLWMIITICLKNYNKNNFFLPFVLLSFNRKCEFSWPPSTKVATANYLQSAHSVLLAQVYTDPWVTIYILQQFVRNALKPTPVVSGASQKWESSLSDVSPAESSWDPCGWKVTSTLSLTPGWIHNGLWFFPSFPGIG